MIDFKERVRYLSPGYSPKLYDGDFMSLLAETFEIKFAGAVMLADGSRWPLPNVFEIFK